MLTSICLLAYKRPDETKRCIDLIHQHTHEPFELIVNLDGYNKFEEQLRLYRVLSYHFEGDRISKLIMVSGNNRGVGTSFQNCLNVAEGHYVIKMDADVMVTDGWLNKAKQAMTNDIKCLGLFDYNKWDPNDERFKPENNVIGTQGDTQIVKDIVSCAYMFRRQEAYQIQPVQDDGNHQKFGTIGLIHVVDNKSFGVTKSVYVEGTEDNPRKTKTYTEPLIFNN